MIELTCYRIWEADELQSEPASARCQGEFDSAEDAIKFMAKICVGNNQCEYYVYSVKIVKEGEE